MPDDTMLLSEAIALIAMLDDQNRKDLTPLLTEVLDENISIAEMCVSWSIKKSFDSHRIPSQPSDIPQS